MTTNILLTLTWLVTTNWHDAGASRTLMYPDSMNTTTYYERGQAFSNLIGTLDWNGNVVTVHLESVLFAECSRSYTIKEVRDYGPTHSEPASVWPAQFGTNFFSFTTNDGGIWLNWKTNVILMGTNGPKAK